MPSLTWHLEEPRVGQSYPNYYAAQLASKFVKVVLSGAGGDELFGGYPWRYYRGAVNRDFDALHRKVLRVLAEAAAGRSVQRRHFVRSGPIGLQRGDKQIFRDVFPSDSAPLTRPEDYINYSLYFEAKTFLHGLLVVEDKLRMAHSSRDARALSRQRSGRLRIARPGEAEAREPSGGGTGKRERAWGQDRALLPAHPGREADSA